jgi:hypothetical protein
MCSTKFAAVDAMRRPKQEGQNPLPLQLNVRREAQEEPMT